MFEFSRELKRLFTPDAPKDGLTGGRAPLLELLDMALLRGEARSADIAAGRISAKDPAQRSLEAARVWREVARRTGDPVALRKAAVQAERAAEGFQREHRGRRWAGARVEQALVAMTGAELLGDEGLNAAAEYALAEVAADASASAAAAVAAGRLVRLQSQALLRAGDADAVLQAAAAFDAPIAGVEAQLRTRAVAKSTMIDLRCDRAELLLAAGSRLRDCGLLSRALAELDALVARLDSTYEPLGWARALELRGAAQVALGEARGELDLIADGVAALADALDMVLPLHSPLDWARLQHSLGLGLRALADAGDNEIAYEQALCCFDRTLWALKDQPAVLLRAAAAANRAACLARRAELTGDAAAIEAALAAVRGELVGPSAAKDPVVWAVCQVNLARLYETRAVIRGAPDRDLADAAIGLAEALEVFGEHGLRTLTDEAARTLERVAARNRSDA